MLREFDDLNLGDLKLSAATSPEMHVKKIMRLQCFGGSPFAQNACQVSLVSKLWTLILQCATVVEDEGARGQRV